MLQWIRNFRNKFIEDCRYWWKMWSTWLAVVWGLITTVLWNEPQVLQEITNVMPEEIRALLSPVVFAIIAGLPILVRLLKQQKLMAAIEKKKEGEQ